jgi:Protein of unknown function (DUF3108)
MASMLRALPLALAGLVLCASAATPADAPPGVIATRFEVFGFAGIRVLGLRSRTEEMAGHYSIAVHYATHGLASLFIDLTTQAEVYGRLVPGSAQPERFRKDTRRNGDERHDQVVFRPDGMVVAAASPPPPDPPAPAQIRGTVDNLTAYFRLERQLAATGRCALSERVFDGRHRYDLVFTDAGRQKLAPESGQNFAGETIACHMNRYNRDTYQSAEAEEGARSGIIWYARLVPGDLMVPVRMRLDTQLGSVEGYLAELHGRGVNDKLME